MPAFQLSQQSMADVLQLCGVKRKAEPDTEVDYLCRSNYEEHPDHKRICLCPEEEGFDSGNDQTEINSDVSYAESHPVMGLEANNEKAMTTDMHTVLQSADSQRVGVVSSVAGATQSQVTDSMEVDYSADHQTLFEQTSIQDVQAQIDSKFCEDHCGLESASPVSGLLRCYCRPSWEGMVEMQLYRSDYY